MRIPRSKSQFKALETRFLEGGSDASLEPLVAAVRKRGYLTKPELLAVGRWKSPRALPLVRRNSPGEIQEATRNSLRTRHERLRIGTLLVLQGVSWPTASVILHYFHTEAYPVLDVRATWSLGIATPSAYSFEFWARYVTACRELASTLGLSMRTVDRALWQFSKERQ